MTEPKGTTNHNQKVYQVGCSHCGHVYGSNATYLTESVHSMMVGSSDFLSEDYDGKAEEA